MLFLIHRNQVCETSLILSTFAVTHHLNMFNGLLHHVFSLMINHYNKTIDSIVQMSKHVHIELSIVICSIMIMIPFSRLFSIVIS